MINKIIKLLLVLLILGTALYIVNLNSSQITVAFSKSKTYSASTGLILILTFLSGFLFAALIASIFGIKNYIKEKRMERKQRQQASFYSEVLKARSLSAVNNYGEATDAWSKLIKKDPTDLIARLELANCLIKSGGLKNALKVLDETRAIDSTNTEVLMTAARLNEELNNKTAALDNLALLLYNSPSAYIADKARNLSKEIGRYDDALEYHKKYVSLGGSDKDSNFEADLQFKKLPEIDLKSEGVTYDKNTVKAYKTFIKRYPNYVEARIALAELLKSNGEFDNACEILVEAAKESGDASYWQAAAKLWIDNNMVDNALAAAKVAVREASGIKKLEAQVVYIKLLIAVNKLEEAKSLLNGFYELANNENADVSDEIARDILILTGLCLNRMGEYKESAFIWKRLSKQDFKLDNPEFKDELIGEVIKPEPMYSTP